MYCKNCGDIISGTSLVCPTCQMSTVGGKINYCSKCGQHLEGRISHCPGCGTEIAGMKYVHCSCGMRLGANVMVCPGCGATVVKQQESARENPETVKLNYRDITPQKNDTTTIGLVIIALVCMVFSPIVTYLTAGLAISRAKKSGSEVLERIAIILIIIAVIWHILLITVVYRAIAEQIISQIEINVI